MSALAQALEPMVPVLEADELVKVFGGRGLRRSRAITAVDHVTVAIERSATVAVVGESGCGKTTLARLLLGLQQPDAGEVRFEGQPLASLNAAGLLRFRRAVQMIFQHPQQSFNPMLTIGSSLRDAFRLRSDLSSRERDLQAVELLSLAGLDPSMRARRRSELSGGELQRAALARALASDPRALVLDEPTSALDASVRGQVVELLQRLQQQKQLGYLLITHDMRLVRMMASHVLVMYLGQVVEEGDVHSILNGPKHPYTRSLLAAAELGRERLRTAAAVRGEVSELDPGYVGCRFAPRCRHGIEGCEQPQKLRQLSPHGRVRCWRAEELAAGELNTREKKQ
jgi:oligopeptide/dipeptide ABC transporter ATP-binding protein